ncbi:hypothetical protein OZ410_04045 [Robiginitalea sp. M366]|uniref:hypothetical protein n=1 Tax=Robiginitalea aestuariiviva TaxID=3036903 RepID=UPI00240E0697|nr:hypothetical protein [Robiginitalea aestuariiviva]MDG1571474.1 hypothetical protein [Robiginitalea aestuariiviva]
MKNICFIANYYKTYVFVEIANQLKEHGINSYWIIPSKKQFQELRKEFPEEQLLYIGKKDILKLEKNPLPFDLKLNELIYGDRVLKYESKQWTYDYLQILAFEYYGFIKRNNLSHIFGEITWAHELLLHRLTLKAKELNCEFLNPHTIRIPNRRFAFFTDEFQSIIKEVSISSLSGQYKIEIEKPSYLKLNDKIVARKSSIRYNLTLLKNFVLRTNQDSNDPTLYSNPFTLFKIRSKEILNRIVFNYLIKEKSRKELPEDLNFILFTLHKQPEASIDVLGRYYENQIELIKNIWRILPMNHILLVKEHSNAIGDRSISFYREIKKLKNVYLINHREDSHKLLDISRAVFTVSGTIAYEAALMGKYAFTFAPVFFNRMKHCMEVSWKDFRTNSFEDLLNKNQSGVGVDIFSKWLMENSFDGIMSDSFGDPRSIKEQNIQFLSEAFTKIIK